MAKGIIGSTYTQALANKTASATGSDRILTEVDMKTTRNALWIVMFEFTTNPCSDVQLVSSHVSDSWTAGTAAAASDVVTITQDTVSSTGAVTITTNSFTLAVDGIYVFQAEGLRRYCNVTYTCNGTGSSFSSCLVGLDQEQALLTKQTAY